MNVSDFKFEQSRSKERPSHEQGFTLLETAIALVIMMIVGLGVASLFSYATRANSSADDRELAMALGQKRMEMLRTIPFTTLTRNVAFSYPNGGLGATGTAGVVETVTNAGRSYVVTTIIQDTSVVPVGNPDAGAPTVKSIQVSVTPLGSATAFDTVTLSTQRSTLVVGMY
jgi:Tfp pilus assembly protein PilV